MIRYRCQHCGVKLESPDELSGTTDTCPECGKTTVVPLSKQQKQQIAQKERALRTQREAAQLAQRQQEHQEIRSQESTEQPRPAAGALRPAKMPSYTGLTFIEALYLIVGIIFIVCGVAYPLLALARSAEEFLVALVVGIAGVVLGMLMVGFGQVFGALRDIAQNTWYLR